MTQDNPNDFDEAEWQSSKEGSPSFEFTPDTGKPDFEPTGDSSKGNQDEFEQAWSSPEPPPGGNYEQERPEYTHTGDAHNPYTPNAEDRQWAAIGHAAGAVSVLVTGGVAGWLVPLIIWLIRKDDGGFAAEQAKEALNFQITAFLLTLIAFPLLCIGVGFIIVLAVPICSVIFSIIGAIKTWNGEEYDYPINFRLI